MTNWHRIGITACGIALAACSSSSTGSSGTTEAADGAAPHDGAAGSNGEGSAPSSGGSSGGPSEGGAPDGSASSAADAKLVVDVPASFTGSPREIDVVVVPQLPVAGPPAGILYQQKSPVITVGQPLTIHGDATGVSGENYVVVVLYMQGGGTFSPKAGVDYVAQSTGKFEFTGGPVDLGTLTLALAGP